jgi:hypothetical protein
MRAWTPFTLHVTHATYIRPRPPATSCHLLPPPKNPDVAAGFVEARALDLYYQPYSTYITVLLRLFGDTVVDGAVTNGVTVVQTAKKPSPNAWQVNIVGFSRFFDPSARALALPRCPAGRLPPSGPRGARGRPRSIDLSVSPAKTGSPPKKKLKQLSLLLTMRTKTRHD